MLPYPANPRTSRPSPSQWALQLGRIFERVAVFALSGTSAQVVAVRGLGHRALGVTLSLVDTTPLRWAIEAASPVVGSGRAPGGDTIPQALGLEPPRAYAVIPLAMPGGIVGLAYADVGGKALSLPQVTAAFAFCQRALEGGSAPVASHRPSPRKPRRGKPHALRAESPRTPEVNVVAEALGPDLGIVAATFGPPPRALDLTAVAFSTGADPAMPVPAVEPRSPEVAGDPPPVRNHDLEPAEESSDGDGPSWGPPSALQRAHELLGEGDGAMLFTALVQESMAGLDGAENDASGREAELAEVGDVVAIDEMPAGDSRPVPIIPSAATWVPSRRGAVSAAVAGGPRANGALTASAALSAAESMTTATRAAFAAAEPTATATRAASAAAKPTTTAHSAASAAAKPTTTAHSAASAIAEPTATAAAPSAAEPTAAAPRAAPAAPPPSDLTPATGVRHSARPLLHARSRWARRGAGSSATSDPSAPRLPEAQPVILTAEAARPVGPTMTTVYADQVAVVTPSGVVPLGRPSPRIGVLRAFSTTVAAAASLVAVALTLVAPASAPTTPARSVTIPPQASLATIARELEADGLVRSAAGFTWLARLSGADRGLRAGTYRLSPGAWAWQQLRALTGGQLDTATVTVPEGLTMREIAELFETHGLARADDFVAAASDQDVLSRYDLPGPTAEGFLFPNTYVFARGLAARDLVEVMIREFFGRVSALPGVARATRDELVRRVVLASIIEREARDKSELGRIAGVFENRITRNMKLESCATVQYVLGHRKDRLSLADVRRPSPYNTYLIHGLPPGAISSPGLDALKAAFAPEHHELLFFFAKEDGSHRHVFTRTYAEHLSAQRLVARRD